MKLQMEKKGRYVQVSATESISLRDAHILRVGLIKLGSAAATDVVVDLAGATLEAGALGPLFEVLIWFSSQESKIVFAGTQGEICIAQTADEGPKVLADRNLFQKRSEPIYRSLITYVTTQVEAGQTKLKGAAGGGDGSTLTADDIIQKNSRLKALIAAMEQQLQTSLKNRRAAGSNPESMAKLKTVLGEVEKYVASNKL